MIPRPLPLLLLLSSCAAPSPPPTVPPSVPIVPDPRPAIDAFNRALIDATTRMDNAATLALWEDDGVSLLPSTKPIVGKNALASFLEAVTTQLPGAHMRTFEMQCAGIEASGDVASEYCDEHQVVDLGAGKPPFDGHGKMLLVLHRGADGKWRARREMWNEGVKTPAP